LALACAIIAASGIAIAQGKEDPERLYLGKEYAEAFLRAAMSGQEFNLVGRYPLVPDERTAISIAEAVLFNIYGEENIRDKAPYEAHRIEGYWLVFGTLAKNHRGGTFKIIIEAETAHILLIGHDK
jgi:hypothetical protein